MSDYISWSSGLTHDAPPGVVIDHSPTGTKQYIGSPGIAVLDSGEYIASHDIFGPGSNADTTCVFASRDQGQTWQKIARIGGQFWSSLFVHRGSLYLMGTSREYGFGIIRRSIDGGRTWSEPKNADCGLLLAGGMYHCAPVPLVTHNGRLWRAMEEYTGPKWGAFNAFVMSIEEDVDLLKASNWVQTNRVLPNPEWLGGQFGAFLEGNVCIDPAGKIVNVLRVHHPSIDEYAAVMSAASDGKTLTFDPVSGFFHMPGGSKKFTIRFDAETECYYALLNAIPGGKFVEGLRPDQMRNGLYLASSPDLRQWELRRAILMHPDAATVGFQYVD